MRGSLPARCAFLLAAAIVLGQQLTSARQNPSALPPLPFEDVGACPFEGCSYREWVANAPIAIRTERRDDAPIVFRVQAGERVSALTGVVVTRQPGRVQFREAARLESLGGPIQVAPGETLYLLTYQGEGFSKVWFKGRLHTDVDITDFLDEGCRGKATRCVGRLIEESQTDWWVRIRNRLGNEGWTRETAKFDGKDELAWHEGSATPAVHGRRGDTNE
jgi:hypothetical protein